MHNHFAKLAVLRSWSAYALLPLVGIVTAPILARALGPAGRGELAAMLQPLTVASAVAALGVPSAVTFFIGRGWHPRSVRNVGLIVVTITTVCVGIALFFYSAPVAQQSQVPRYVLLVLWLAFLPSGVIAIFRAERQAEGQFFSIDLERSSGALLRLGFVVVLGLVMVSNPAIFGAAYMAAGLLASLWLLRKSPPKSDLLYQETRSSAVIRYSLLASIGTISSVLNSRLDQALLPAALNSSELGFYSIAVTVAEVPAIVTLVIVRNLLSESSRGATSKVLRQTIGLGLVGIVSSCGLLAVAIPLLVPLAFGSDFLPAVQPSLVLVLATALTFATECTTAVRMGAGRPGLGALGPASGAVATIVLLVVLWPFLSAVLAAWVAVAAQAIALLSVLVLPKLYPFAPRARRQIVESS